MVAALASACLVFHWVLVVLFRSLLYRDLTEIEILPQCTARRAPMEEQALQKGQQAAKGKHGTRTIKRKSLEKFIGVEGCISKLSFLGVLCV